MVRIMAMTTSQEWLIQPPIETLKEDTIAWYWMDFDQPTEEESSLLASFFAFHPLAIEDCLQFLQRPKLEYYGDHNFLVMHALNEHSLSAHEVDLFIGERFIVSFHLDPLKELSATWEYFKNMKPSLSITPLEVGHRIMDKIVDTYFPIVQSIEDHLLDIENNYQKGNKHSFIQQTFDVRSDLLKVRRTIFPMRDLLYRMLESRRFLINDQQKAYFHDIYDHLLKLCEMIDSSREMTSDIRDNYISLNSYKMNTIMKTLTVITTIFMPLTFLAGIYGMNFENMPELKTENGYFILLGFMVFIGIGMYIWFRKKGWFDQE
ncbi:magnesium and cobalt transport protein CorA [Fictibacillus macauensis ZFHKF-1]|uniref:Magnesium transport protein CorA n=1 Tax=Fictibacillus macauensis ZFHKF-1 TaxID=1196324 RepID=I8UGR2_9BACL|nr:magnesium/cobalt transporter CorA [Fictibacillus macauensis]EIT85983.1 magnesium and cobalt transport protein CorA [Fictibacillus macauensis ZFHKF-1]